LTLSALANFNEVQFIDIPYISLGWARLLYGYLQEKAIINGIFQIYPCIRGFRGYTHYFNVTDTQRSSAEEISGRSLISAGIAPDPWGSPGRTRAGVCRFYTPDMIKKGQPGPFFFRVPYVSLRLSIFGEQYNEEPVLRSGGE